MKQLFVAYETDTSFSKGSRNIIIVSSNEEDMVDKITKKYNLSAEESESLWEEREVVTGGRGLMYLSFYDGEMQD